MIALASVYKNGLFALLSALLSATCSYLESIRRLSEIIRQCGRFLNFISRIIIFYIQPVRVDKYSYLIIYMFFLIKYDRS